MLKLIGISRQYGICQVLVIKYRYYFATQYFFTLFFHIVSLFQCERDVSKLLLRLFTIFFMFLIKSAAHTQQRSEAQSREPVFNQRACPQEALHHGDNISRYLYPKQILICFQGVIFLACFCYQCSWYRYIVHCVLVVLITLLQLQLKEIWWLLGSGDESGMSQH